jgi:hypothetical protein
MLSGAAAPDIMTVDETICDVMVLYVATAYVMTGTIG